MDSSLESQRSSLQTVLDTYVSQHYAGSDAAASVLAKDGKLVIHISGERPNLRNYWSGRWQSQWTLTPSGSNAALSGEIKVTHDKFKAGNMVCQAENRILFLWFAWCYFLFNSISSTRTTSRMETCNSKPRRLFLRKQFLSLKFWTRSNELRTSCNRAWRTCTKT